MSIILKWNSENINNIYKFKIEKGASINGVFSPLVELDADINEYEDLSGDETYWYKMIMSLILIKNEIIIFDVSSKTLSETELYPINNMERIIVNDITLIKDIDYTINYSTGVITCLNTNNFPIGSEANIKYKYLEDTDSTFPKHAIVLPMCKIYGYIATPSNDPVFGEVLYIRTYDPPQDSNIKTLSSLPIEVNSGSDGFFDFELLRNSVVNIKCRRLGLDKDIVVPDQELIEFNDFISE